MNNKYAKRFKFCLLIFVSFIFIFLTSCGEKIGVASIEIKEGYESELLMGEFDLNQFIVVAHYYNGRTQEIALDKDKIRPSEYLKFFKEGKQTIEVRYGGCDTSFEINILRKKFDDSIQLKSETFVYDGLEHSLSIVGSLPSGTQIIYPSGNSAVNVGAFTVTAVITCENYETRTLEGTMVVKEADYDMSEVKFENKNYVYDGTEKSIEVENLPSDVTVSYTIGNEIGNSAINAGVYKVIASFAINNRNYNKIESMEAYLTIEKAKYDMSKVTMDDLIVTYDGTSHAVFIEDETLIPSGVVVKYSDNIKVNAGEYIAIASFTGDARNYESIPDITAKLIILKDKIILNGIYFDTASFEYDGNKHINTLDESKLPAGISVVYLDEYGQEFDGAIEEGVYTVIAKFVLSDELAKNYEEIPNMRSSFIIVYGGEY